VNLSARPRALLVTAATCLMLLSLPAEAQESRAGERELTLQESRDILQARNRNRMHPGDPLALVGVEQGGNDIRSMTPALANSDRYSLPVDQDEAYARALAMYDSRAMFSAPMAPSPEARVTQQRKPAHSQVPKSAPVEGGAQWPWLVAFAIAIAFMVWLGKHFSDPQGQRRAGGTR
jgi:hypothetical protein